MKKTDDKENPQFANIPKYLLTLLFSMPNFRDIYNTKK
jgi:hypothetical protein